MNNGRTSTYVLNRLVALHNRSLAEYLASAAPFQHAGDNRAMQTLRLIVADQQRMAGRFAALVLEQGEAIYQGHFPMKYTAWHDLGLEFLVPRLIEDQQARVAAIAECVSDLALVPYARALAEEALGLAKGHLESLQELLPAAAQA